MVVTSGATFAQTATGNLTVTANVAVSCSVATSALDFGNVNQGADTDEATPGSVTITCTDDEAGVTLDIGGGQNETAGQRRLQASGNFISYNVYSDAAHTNVIGVDGTIFSGNITAATPQVVSVYGRIPSGTYVSGSYTDVLVVTLTY